jgi:hypothetical protein
MHRQLYVLQVAILAIFGIASVLFSGFSAEDAFITYRYAENLATHGSFVFNVGEPIMAITSPLHGVVVSLLFQLTGHSVLANKVLGLVLLLAAATAVWMRYLGKPFLQALVAALILLPPCVALWTFGGLETPLLLFLVTIATLLAADTGSASRRQACWVAFLAGLAFVTRFDSILFLGPLVLHMAFRARSISDVLIASAVGGALPAAWLAVSLAYFGDLFPTSFYSKTPDSSVPVLIGNGKYILFNLFVVGMIPATVLVVALGRPWRFLLGLLLSHFKGMWWLYIGIAAELLYGLTMATTHMMFSFRYFVPYLPVLAILIADLAGRAMEERETPEADRMMRTIPIAAVLCLVVLQMPQIYYTYEKSVNGLSPWGEYPSVGVRQYNRFIETLHQEADDIREHWNTVGNERHRAPRIYTFAGGVVPYRFRDAYIYETLASWRHCYDESSLIQAPNVWMKTNVDLRLSADYIHVVTPRHGSIGPQLPLPEHRFSLVSSYEIEFDGYPERFLVFFNPEPEQHRLTNTIDGMCTTSTSTSRAD